MTRRRTSLLVGSDGPAGHRRVARSRPVVYACSGYSAAAQLANQLALAFDREGVAEMSCIAGVGGAVPALVKVARSGRPMIALDGCPLHCVAACLDREGVEPTVHVTLSEYGAPKRRHVPISAMLAGVVRDKVVERLREAGLLPETVDPPCPASAEP